MAVNVAERTVKAQGKVQAGFNQFNVVLLHQSEEMDYTISFWHQVNHQMMRMHSAPAQHISNIHGYQLSYETQGVTQLAVAQLWSVWQPKMLMPPSEWTDERCVKERKQNTKF